MKQDRKEKGPESIQVAFGDEFSYSQEKDKKYIVVELGEGNIVQSAAVIEVEGKEVLGLAGTTQYKDIAEISSRWSLDRIINGYRNYFIKSDPLRSEREDLLKENSKSPPKTLTKS